MPIVKKHEPIKERPVIIAIYGGPGLGKTSLGNTAKDPINLDFDRGIDRSYNRQDTLQPENWEEVLQLEAAGAFAPYATRVIDTAKACLDDFLMTYVRSIDPKNRSNKLAAYGAIGDEFKIFCNSCRTAKSDLLIIAHAKEKEEGGLNMTIPDVTGQSYQLILRISDMVGFLYMKGGKRMIRWEPTDETKGKNVAKLPDSEIPDVLDPAYSTYMADLFELVRKSLVEKSKAQLEAEAMAKEYLDLLAKCETPEALTEILTQVNTLPNELRIPIKKEVVDVAKARGYVANKETRRYELPAADAAPETDTDVQGTETKPPLPDLVDPKNVQDPPPGVFTTLDERSRELEKLGATLEADGFTYGKMATFMSYEEAARLPEDDFNKLLKTVKKAAPKPAAATAQK